MRENRNQAIRLFFAIFAFALFAVSLNSLASRTFIEKKPTIESTTELFATVTDIEEYGETNLGYIIYTDRYDDQIFIEFVQIKDFEKFQGIQVGDTINFRLKNEEVENFLDGYRTMSVVWLECGGSEIINFDSYYTSVEIMNKLMTNLLTAFTVIMAIITLMLLFFIIKCNIETAKRFKKIRESQTFPLADLDIFSESDPFEDAETHVNGTLAATYKMDSEKFKKATSKFMFITSLAAIIVLGLVFTLLLGLTINDVIHHDSDAGSFVIVGMLLLILIYYLVAIFITPKMLSKIYGIEDGNQKNYCAEFSNKFILKNLSERTKQEIEYNQITYAYEIDDSIVLFTNFRQVIVVIASKLSTQQIDKIFLIIKSKNKYCKTRRQKK